MALPEPPTNVPRIADVQNPSTGHYVVIVRMPTQLAAKFPDKAWGTPIESVGLAKQDSDRFPGYTLVDVEPLKGSPDLYWIFQKLSGPVWTTKTIGSEEIIPQKFRSQVSQTKTRQEVASGTQPDAITGDLISSVVEEQDNTGKAIKVNTSETIDANAAPLVSPSLEDQLYVTTEILVAEGSLPDTGTGVIESSVQAIGKGKAIKVTKFAVTAYTNKTTYTVGYATLLNENVGSADSIPAKFKALKSIKTWRFRVQAASPPSTPALGTGSGAYAGYDIVERAIKQTQENGSTDVFEMVVVGLANTGDNSLDSVTYGKIVTTTTTETLAASSGLSIDTGLAIIASTVEELGNGMSIKSTEQVQGGAWPTPLDTEVSKEFGNRPPARYLKDLTTTKTTSKIAAASVPSVPTLSGNQTGKAYKKETPDRAEEVVTSETLNLSVKAIDESVQQRPFVKITTQMTPGPAKVLPLAGNGASRLVYEGTTSDIYENTKEVAEARVGPAGANVDARPFVTIATNKRYSTSGAISTNSGSANMIYNDGAVIVYEISEEVATARSGPSGSTKDRRPFVEITANKKYSTSNTIATANGSANVVFNDGSVIVYEVSEETAVAKTGPAGSTRDRRPFVEITTERKYATSNTISTPTGSASIVFDDGLVVVYQIEEEKPVAREGTAGIDKDVKPYGSFSTNKRYSVTNVINAPEGSASVVYNNGEVIVYEVGERTFTPTYREIGVELDKNVGFTRETTSRYSATSAVTANSGASNIAYTNGVETVFEVKEVRLVPTAASFVSAEQSTKVFRKTVNTSYATSPTGTGSSYEAGVAATDGVTTIYKVDSTTISAQAPLVYETVLRATVPSTLLSIDLFPINRRDRRMNVSVFVNVEEGYTGAFPGRVTEFYTENPDVLTGFVPFTFRPTSINYQGIYFNLSIGETLHGAFNLTESTGTQDPDFGPQSRSIFIPATIQTEVPRGWQPFAATIDPYENGFLVKKIEIKYRD